MQIRQLLRPNGRARCGRRCSLLWGNLTRSTIVQKELPYPLISDPKRELITALGAGEGGKTKRSHFIFGKGGKLLDKKIPVKPADRYGYHTRICCINRLISLSLVLSLHWNSSRVYDDSFHLLLCFQLFQCCCLSSSSSTYSVCMYLLTYLFRCCFSEGLNRFAGQHASTLQIAIRSDHGLACAARQHGLLHGHKTHHQSPATVH